MFSSPTESSAKARRRNSHVEHNNAVTGSNRRLISRQSSVAGPEEYPAVATVTTKSVDRSIKWHGVSQNGVDLSRGRRFHSAASIGSETFVFGGEQRGEDDTGTEKILLNDLIAFDAVQQIWRVVFPAGKGEDIPKPRKGHSITAWGSKIVLFGGAGDQTYLNDVWIFETQPATPPTGRSPQNSTVWKRIEPIVATRKFSGDESMTVGSVSLPPDPPPRAYHSAVLHEDCLYVYGGYGVSSQTPDVEVWKLNLSEGEWVPMNSTSSIKPGRRYGHVACYFDNSMLIFGGQVRSCLNDSNVYRFNLTTREWTSSPMRRTSGRRSGGTTTNSRSSGAPCPRTYHSAALFESHGRWMIHGGSNEEQTFGDLYEFNIRTERWRYIACPTPVLLEGHTLTIAYTGITYALLSIGGSGNLASQTFRLDLLVPSPSAVQFKLDELIVTSSAVPPLLFYIKEMSGMIIEVDTLRQRTRQQDRKRTMADKLSHENEDLRLQLEEMTKKLELSLREPISRFSNDRSSNSNYFDLESQLKKKQQENDALITELELMRSQWIDNTAMDIRLSKNSTQEQENVQMIMSLNNIAENIKQLRDSSIETIMASDVPSETAINFVTKASNLILNNWDSMQETLAKRTVHPPNLTPDPVRGSSEIPRKPETPEKLNLNRLLTRSDEGKSTGRQTPRSSPNPVIRQDSVKSECNPLVNSTAEESSIPSLPGIDIGSQAGKGKVKLTRASRRK